MNLLDIVSPKAVKAPLQASDKQAAIFELVDLLGEAELVEDTESIKAVVWEREQQRSTGIGDGLAIPHGKSACTPDLVMAIGRPREPIDFGAVDKKPVKLIVLLISPPAKTAEHIQALGKISRLMVNSEFREAAYAAEDSEALYELFSGADL